MQPDARLLKPVRVLVADDEPAVRSVLSDLLGVDGRFELAGVAADAEEAVSLAARLSPDVAIVDVRMPGGGAVAAARGIRLNSPSTKLLVFSAHRDEATVKSMLAEGVHGYLVKGGDLEEIGRALTRCSAGDGYLSEEVRHWVASEMTTHFRIEREQAQDSEAWKQRIQAILDGRLRIHGVYQPIVHLSSSQVVGFEALSRFPGGPTPDVWFDQAEQVGLQRELELVAIRNSLVGLPSLPEKAYLSLNASPATLMWPGFVEELLSPYLTRLVIEVTEHAAISDYGALRSVLAELRKVGVRIAVDDVGSGYATLQHTLELNPDIIKMDRGLTSAIHESRSQRALAGALQFYASEIGARVVAEGIETASQVRELVDLGIAFGQGFHLGRPQPLPGSVEAA